MTSRRNDGRDGPEKLTNALLRSRRMLLTEALLLGAALGVVLIWREQLHPVVSGLLVGVPVLSLLGDIINIWYCKRQLSIGSQRDHESREARRRFRSVVG